MRRRPRLHGYAGSELTPASAKSLRDVTARGAAAAPAPGRHRSHMRARSMRHPYYTPDLVPYVRVLHRTGECTSCDARRPRLHPLPDPAAARPHLHTGTRTAAACAPRSSSRQALQLYIQHAQRPQACARAAMRRRGARRRRRGGGGERIIIIIIIIARATTIDCAGICALLGTC